MDLDLKKAIQQATNEAVKSVGNDGTLWKFIPVTCSHFGGIWKAAGWCKISQRSSKKNYRRHAIDLRRIQHCIATSKSLFKTYNGHVQRSIKFASIPEKSVDTRWELVKKMNTDIRKVRSNKYLL
jgi:hypothetical protein